MAINIQNMCGNGGQTGGGGTLDHRQLTNRDAAEQHPIGAITRLQTELDGKMDASAFMPVDIYDSSDVGVEAVSDNDVVSSKAALFLSDSIFLPMVAIPNFENYMKTRAYSRSQTYNVGECVYSTNASEKASIIYECIQQTTGHDTNDTTYWKKIGALMKFPANVDTSNLLWLYDLASNGKLNIFAGGVLLKLYSASEVGTNKTINFRYYSVEDVATVSISIKKSDGRLNIINCSMSDYEDSQ